MIFLELQKAYDALYRSRCIEILEGYGVGPRSCQLLHTYWRQMTMVTRAGGYYGEALKLNCGVTQVDPLSPIIFNVVVHTVVRHWVLVMVEGAEKRGECGKEVRHHNSLFYADDGMVSLSDPRCLQGAFSTLVGLFDRMGLRNNFRKTVGMVCRPCQAAGTQSESAYRRRMTGEGPSYWEQQTGRVQCR